MFLEREVLLLDATITFLWLSHHCEFADFVLPSVQYYSLPEAKSCAIALPFRMPRQLLQDAQSLKLRRLQT